MSEANTALCRECERLMLQCTVARRLISEAKTRLDVDGSSRRAQLNSVIGFLTDLGDRAGAFFVDHYLAVHANRSPRAHAKRNSH
jgi:hypothetical protein